MQSGVTSVFDITTCLRIGTQLGALPGSSPDRKTPEGMGLELLIGLRIGTTYGHDC